MQRTAEAQRIAVLQEQVRRVTALSRAMNLTATHAMLAERHAVGRGGGRAAKAEEMRAFGRELDRSVNELHRFISRLVRTLFVLGATGSRVDYRAPGERPLGRQLLGRGLPRWERDLAHCREPVPAEWAGLCRKLRHSLHLAETALALVRFAQAEASPEAAGQGMEAAIRHVAEEVGMTARRVRDSVARMSDTFSAGAAGELQ